MNIVSATADLQVFTLTYIYLTNMQMRIGNRIALLYQTYYYTADISTDLIQFLYLETTGEQLLFQFLTI